MKSNLPFKVFSIILCIPLIALIFGGCSDKSGGENSRNNSLNPAASAPTVNSNMVSKETSLTRRRASQRGDITYADGAPVYISEISEICTRNEFDGTLETLAL